MRRVFINRPTPTQQYAIVYHIQGHEVAGLDIQKHFMLLYPKATTIKSHNIGNAVYVGINLTGEEEDGE